MADWQFATRDSKFLSDDLAIATRKQINSADGSIVEAEVTKETFCPISVVEVDFF